MIDNLAVAIYSIGFVIFMMYALLTAINFRPYFHQWEAVTTYLLWAMIAATRVGLVERKNLYWEFVYTGRVLWLFLFMLYIKVLIRHIKSFKNTNKK